VAWSVVRWMPSIICTRGCTLTRPTASTPPFVVTFITLQIVHVI
jgi:hypothetical protein